MIVDWLVYGLIIWGLAVILNKTAFRDKSASRTIAWALSIFLFFFNIIALSTAKFLRYQAISEDLGLKITPNSPLDISGAFLFSYLFFTFLKKKSKTKEVIKELATPSNRAEGMGDEKFELDENKIYEKISEEIDQNTLDKGLWLKFFAESDGNKEKTKIRYIKERFKVLKNKEVEKRKEISEAEILNEEVANEEAHFFDKNIYRDNLLEQGCSKEAIDYLKNPIHVYSYMQKYKKTEEKILDAIKKGKLRGCYVGEALWVENKKI